MVKRGALATLQRGRLLRFSQVSTRKIAKFANRVRGSGKSAVGGAVVRRDATFVNKAFLEDIKVIPTKLSSDDACSVVTDIASFIEKMRSRSF